MISSCASPASHRRRDRDDGVASPRRGSAQLQQTRPSARLRGGDIIDERSLRPSSRRPRCCGEASTALERDGSSRGRAAAAGTMCTGRCGCQQTGRSQKSGRRLSWRLTWSAPTVWRPAELRRSCLTVLRPRRRILLDRTYPKARRRAPTRRPAWSQAKWVYYSTYLLTYLLSHSRGTPLSHLHCPVGQLRSRVVGPEYVGQGSGPQLSAPPPCRIQ